jgi:hypothetical protein
MRSERIPVGSFAFWLVWKLFTILVLLLIPLVAFSSADFKGPMRYVLALILFGILIISNEELVYGHATEHGIHFRRYFRYSSLMSADQETSNPFLMLM